MLLRIVKHSSFLLGVTFVFGLAVFAALFFLVPGVASIRVPFIQKTFLPEAGEREVPVATESTEVTLIFAGDIMMGRNVEATIAQKGVDWPFAELGDLLNNADLVIGNFEAMVREAPRLEVTNEMSFDVTPTNAAELADVGFTHLSLANNHSDDFGASVTASTRATLESFGFVTFGDGYASQDFIARETVDDLRLSFVGYHAFGDSVEAVAQAIANEDMIGQFVIVVPHWGPEYEYKASADQVAAAEAFVEAGADLIIGAHPHVIQNIEIIEGVPVAYSLGNFLFDQNWSVATTQGLTIRVIITDETITLELTPVNVKNQKTTIMTPEEVGPILERLGYREGIVTIERME